LQSSREPKENITYTRTWNANIFISS